ncbi:hypothetical protein [Zoogloea sp.]|uniref:hypothetical protein n=1 Tax=Zoogloea sp. TaxID=49181 RepID=UPI001AD20C14|nr:hypothetical protein [Zoogloea sp.]MBN8283430.1 hypothetical protein [Zoogloea sp.]
MDQSDDEELQLLDELLSELLLHDGLSQLPLAPAPENSPPPPVSSGALVRDQSMAGVGKLSSGDDDAG